MPKAHAAAPAEAGSAACAAGRGHVDPATWPELLCALPLNQSDGDGPMQCRSKLCGLPACLGCWLLLALSPDGKLVAAVLSHRI